MDKRFYFEVLYPVQDEVLRLLASVETGFYLTGGTAASRGYLHHRFSDDLDLFTNDEPNFPLWADRLIQRLSERPGWRVVATTREARFVRLTLTVGGIDLKVEMVNDVPARVGTAQIHPTLGRIDNPENILANKISALIDRREPKDLADIWGFCCQLGLPLAAAIEGAQSKAAGIFPADLARLLCTATHDDWRLVRWIEPPDAARYLAALMNLGEGLILL